jgi:imidazolonepropionase-like amidohydrolase
MPRVLWFYAVLILFLGSGLQGWAQEAGHDKIALKAGKIISMDGEEIENGILLVADGKIEALGRDLEIPYDYWLIDASEGVVFPGMIEAFTTRGLDRANESMPVTPFLDVYDAIDPASVYFEDALRDGTTTLLISQGADTVIGGLARAVKPIGMSVDEMTAEPEAGIILSFSPKSGFDYMVQMATFRATFRELEEYLRDLAETRYEENLKKKGKTLDVGPDEASERGRSLIREEDLDFKHKNLQRLVQGRLRAFLYCRKPLEVVHALDTAEEHGFLQRSVLVLDSACYKALDRIKASDLPVILDPGMVYLKVDPLTGDEEEIFVPKLFHDAGIPFAVRSDPNKSFGTRYLSYQAARLVRNGIPRQAALETITANAAAAIGLGDRLGALSPGKEANLLVLSGDPLDMTTWVEKVFIEGRLVYEREKDYRLKELLTGQENAGKAGEEKDPDGDSPDSESKE